MAVSSPNTSDLPEYETVIAGLVDELQRYKTAVTSLNDAAEASREIHARARAVSTMTETVLDRADSIFTDLQRLDTPSLIPRLSAMEEAISNLTSDVNDLQKVLENSRVQVAQLVESAVDASRESKNAADASLEAMRNEIPNIVARALEPIAANVKRVTYLIYGSFLCIVLLVLLIALRT
jgi:chromosome segregation ATPase